MEKSNEILNDVKEMTTWLEKRNKQVDEGNLKLQEKEIPVLYKVICGGEEAVNALEDKKKKEAYIEYFKKNKKRLAQLVLPIPLVGIGGSVVTSVLTTTGALGAAGVLGVGGAIGGIGALGGISAVGGLGTLGMGLAMPFALPVIAPLVGIGAYKGVKKLKESGKYDEYSEKIKNQYDYCVKKSKECAEKIQENEKIIEKLMKDEIEKNLELIKNQSKKIMINIDDAINSDQNLRLMQYQEIVLKQYNNQHEIETALLKIVESYNKLKIENEELLKRIAEYEDNGKLCMVANEYLK